MIAQIVDRTRQRVAQEKKSRKNREIQLRAESMPRGEFEVERELARKGLSLICEIKKASPDMGVIVPYFPYVNMAQEYAAAGVPLISVWTEPYFYLGSEEYLREIAAKVMVPVIDKDFVIDEYQIYKARYNGATGIFLMAGILSLAELMEYIRICDRLGMSALVEVYTEAEVQQAVQAGARVIVINNRDLETFAVDIEHSIQLSAGIPHGIYKVSEGGIKTQEQVQRLQEAGMDGLLLSEVLMRGQDRKTMIRYLKGEL